jgi:hypothetical protein
VLAHDLKRFTQQVAHKGHGRRLANRERKEKGKDLRPREEPSVREKKFGADCGLDARQPKPYHEE